MSWFFLRMENGIISLVLCGFYHNRHLPTTALFNYTNRNLRKCCAQLLHQFQYVTEIVESSNQTEKICTKSSGSLHCPGVRRLTWNCSTTVKKKGYKNLCCLEKQSFRIVEFLWSFSLRMCTQTVPLKGRNFEIKINQLPCFRPLTRVSGSYNI